jgi:hypothetical protein
MQWKMANEMGCYATTWEFMHERDSDERRLFPHVDAADTPENTTGGARPEAVAAIKKNIVHLYRWVWGIDVAEGAPEVEQAYSLFYDTWRAGRDAIAAGEESINTPCGIKTQPGEAFGTPLEAGLQPLELDKDYTLRSWAAVLTYLLADPVFLYE